jgi:septal ring factor EnvC (AmiA/AmiB activator)
MKSLKQIKKELHEYIDSIDDEKKIMAIYENTFKCLKSDSHKVEMDGNSTVTEISKERSGESEIHGNSNQIETDKESRKGMSRWFSDGGKNSC